MAAVYESLLTAVKDAVVGLNLPGITTNVEIMKLPAAEEEIDTLPLMAVVPADKDEKVRYLSFEGDKEVTYEVEVVAISKGKKLLGATGNADANDNLFRQVDWRQSVRNSLINPATLSASVSQVRGTTVEPGRPVDRKKVNQDYDFSPLRVQVRTQE